jgi:D,D-heptose 1,7-bisphosphate phosphatase
MPANKAAFLDRDGVINLDRPDYTKTWDEFVFSPGAAEALVELRKMGFFLIGITNQACIGRGLTTLASVEDIHRRMQAALAEKGAALDAIYFCPHKPEDGCACRKPRTGNLELAAKKFTIDFTRSFMAGDSARDVETGAAMGMKTVFIASSGRTIPPDAKAKPDIVVRGIAELPAAVRSMGL